MKRYILAVNSGSSSLKLSLFNPDNKLSRWLDVHLQEIQSQNPKLEVTDQKGKRTCTFSSDEKDPIEAIFSLLFREYGFDNVSIEAIGHRFVHGGKEYVSPVQIDATVMQNLAKLAELAPLHNASCFNGIRGCKKLFGDGIPQIAIFDTAFHKHIPAVASQYAIPLEIAERYSIKRYGFHGISHDFLWDSYSHCYGSNSKIITIHLGNGCSMSAIQNGVSIDTSMGFSPSEGLVMGTRTGDIDTAVMEFICTNDNKTASEVLNIFNSQSGLLGVSEISSEMNKVLSEYRTNDKAKLAVDMFCYRIVKYLGAYLAILKGVDAIIFSGGIGENAPEIRSQVIRAMEWFGVYLDENANKAAINLESGMIKEISTPQSSLRVLVIPTDENLKIAQIVVSLLRFL